MTALLRRSTDLLTARNLGLGLLAGAAWGAAMTAGMAGLRYASEGQVCLDDVAGTAMLSTALGILAIGPVAILTRKA